jgi:hypothetical protein
MTLGRVAVAARPTLRVPLGGVLAHAVMLVVMAVTMIGVHSPLRCLIGAGLLMIAAVAYAPGARRRLSGWEHVLDFWAMVALLVSSVGGGVPASGGGEHQHLLSLDRVVGIIIVGASWVGLRLLVLLLRASRGEKIPVLAWASSAAMTAAGLVVMALYCGEG